MKRVELLDSTLRDGAQSVGISFSLQEKLKIVQIIDELGIPFIEAGNPGSNSKDKAFFSEATRLNLKTAELVAFGSTRRKNIPANKDPNLHALLCANTKFVSVFGKTSLFHVVKVIETNKDENLNMIFDTIRFLRSSGREVFFDAEHFFDGYQLDAKYAIDCLRVAAEAGATRIILCDTNGGTLPDKIGEITANVKKNISIPLGIHCHNDCGTAVANTICAVQAGVRQVQGTILGIGERCGNTDLTTLIPSLQLKQEYFCIPSSSMKNLKKTAEDLASIANIKISCRAPYVGDYAFSHKAGMHIDAVAKDPHAYEHIRPEEVGNTRNYLISEMAGRTALLSKAYKIDPNLNKQSPALLQIMNQIKAKEQEGYHFEKADGSLDLLIRRVLMRQTTNLRVVKLRYSQDEKHDHEVEVEVTVRINGEMRIAAQRERCFIQALNNALFHAARLCGSHVRDVNVLYQEVHTVKDCNKFCVLVTVSDGDRIWNTEGVADSYEDAVLIALVDALEYAMN